MVISRADSSKHLEQKSSEGLHHCVSYIILDSMWAYNAKPGAAADGPAQHLPQDAGKAGQPAHCGCCGPAADSAKQVSPGCRVCMLLGGQVMHEQPAPAQHRREKPAGMVLAYQRSNQRDTDLLSVRAIDFCPLHWSLKTPRCCSSLLNALHQALEACWRLQDSGRTCMVACSKRKRPAVKSLPAATHEAGQVLRSWYTALATTCSRPAYSWPAGPSRDMQAPTSMQSQTALRDTHSMAPHQHGQPLRNA